MTLAKSFPRVSVLPEFGSETNEDGISRLPVEDVLLLLEEPLPPEGPPGDGGASVFTVSASLAGEASWFASSLIRVIKLYSVEGVSPVKTLLVCQVVPLSYENSCSAFGVRVTLVLVLL